MEDSRQGNSHSSSARRFWAITPSDTAPLKRCPVGIYVIVTGDVSATDDEGNTVVFPAVPAHTVLPIRPVRINLATTATVVGLD